MPEVSPIATDCVGTAKKEAKRLEKEAKAAAKVSKAPVAPAGEKKVKEVKEKKEAEPEFVNTTPSGQKKGERHAMRNYPNTHRRRPLPEDGRRIQPNRRRIRLV